MRLTIDFSKQKDNGARTNNDEQVEDACVDVGAGQSRHDLKGMLSLTGPTIWPD
jgi:hypothetical protein